MSPSNLVLLNKQDQSSSSPNARNYFSLEAIWGTDVIDLLLETPSPDSEVEVTQVGTPIAGNETLTISNTVVQGSLGEDNLKNQLTVPSQMSNEIRVWTQIMQQKKNDMIEKMREQMQNKLETILKK